MTEGKKTERAALGASSVRHAALRNLEKILDSGHIKLVEHWGSDERIIEAAR